MSDPGLVALQDARAKVEAKLVAAFVDADPPIEVLGPLDAIEPPCVRIAWSEPWLEPFGQAGAFAARMEILAIAGRFEPTSGFEEIERVVTLTVRALNERRAGYPYVVTNVGAPRGYDVAGKTYLAAAIVLRLPAGVE